MMRNHKFELFFSVATVLFFILCDWLLRAESSPLQQYLREGLIDELHIPIAPVLLGSGQRLFEGVNLRALGYECVEFAASEKATHVVLRHQGPWPAGEIGARSHGRHSA